LHACASGEIHIRRLPQTMIYATKVTLFSPHDPKYVPIVAIYHASIPITGSIEMEKEEKTEVKRSLIKTAKDWGGRFFLTISTTDLTYPSLPAKPLYRKPSPSNSFGNLDLCPTCKAIPRHAHDLPTSSPVLYLPQPPRLQD
jgi:hypothetical protein